MASNMGIKEKKIDYTEFAIYAAAVLAVIILCVWVGYVFEMTASPKNGIQLMKALSSLGEYAAPVSFIRAFEKVFTGSGITRKSELDFIFDKRKENDPKALSVQYYEEFKQAAGKTMQSILISTTTKLQHFKLEDVRNLTYTDNIHLETMGDEKTALFIIIPSTDTTYNFLAAMMYTQLFDTLYDRAITYYHGRLPVHVRFILDEFANVGKIPEFEKILATCRKFEISAVVILQNLSQLKRLY